MKEMYKDNAGNWHYGYKGEKLTEVSYSTIGKYYPKETEIDWRKEFEDMVRYIGVIDYGKERWFMETEKSGRVKWYDRYDGEYLTTDELQQRIYEVVRKLDDE